jgi:thioredoxin reductase
MHGFLTKDGSSPRDLIREGRAEVARYGGALIGDTVVRIERRFEVLLASGDRLKARRILLATGLKDELPDIPGVRERWGRDLLHCPYCHGFEVRDRPLGVLGGTVEAVQHAVLIRQWSADVILFPHHDRLSTEQRELLTAREVGVVDGRVARVVIERDELTGVELADGRLVPRTAVFVRPRFVPNSRLLVDLGCDADHDGWLTTDGTGRTTVSGVWAAGNAADPRAQVITAAGQGSAAAIAVNGDLVQEDSDQALAAHRASSAVHARLDGSQE